MDSVISTYGEHVDSLKSGEPIFARIDDVIGIPIADSPSWEAFVRTWHDLPQDMYMNDGGTYRQRRFSRFHLNINTRELRLKRHAPYSQPAYLNPLNGNMLRHFEPCAQATIDMPVFRDTLIGVGVLLGLVDDCPDWDINVYQNRTLASDEFIGKPVPEGIHRDGVRYSVLLGIHRLNVEGAVSTVFNDDKIPVITETVTEGDVLIFRDETSYHDTTPVHLSGPGHTGGSRDVMVIEYYHSSGNNNQYYVP